MYVYLNEEDQFCECYSCLKMVILPHFHVVFLQYFSSNVYYLNDSIYLWNCCNQGQLLNKKGNHEVSSHYNVCMKRFTTPKKYNCNSTHSYNRKIWVDIPSYIVFPWTHITLIGHCLLQLLSILNNKNVACTGLNNTILASQPFHTPGHGRIIPILQYHNIF